MYWTFLGFLPVLMIALCMKETNCPIHARNKKVKRTAKPERVSLKHIKPPNKTVRLNLVVILESKQLNI